MVSLLEGGYDLKALAESANYHVNALIESENKKSWNYIKKNYQI